MISKPNLSVAKAVNPETGEEDLVGALRYVMKKLANEKCLEKDGVFCVMKGAIQKLLTKYGVSSTYLADFLLVMQEIGLVRKYGNPSTIKWEIVDQMFLDSFIHDEAVRTAVERVTKRHHMHRKIASLTKRLKKAISEEEETSTSAELSTQLPPTPDLTNTLEKIGELIAEIEELKKELKGKEAEAKMRDEYIASQGEKIKALEGDLANRPTDIDKVLAQAIEKARQKRS